MPAQFPALRLTFALVSSLAVVRRFFAISLCLCLASAGQLSASTFAPSAGELADSPTLAAEARLDLSELQAQIDSTGRRYYAVDDQRYAAETVELDNAFTGNTWPGGILYYQFAASVTSSNRTAWRQAADTWEAVSPVRFIEGVGTGNYVLVKSTGSNSSYVGMIGGAQEMQIFNWNFTYVIAHEIGHALGLEHEQSRSDRDSYVRILYANIQSGEENNFQRFSTVNYGPYDFDSIMHYSRLAFSSNDQNTIEPLPAYSGYLYTMGQRDHLSSEDGAGMAQRYFVGSNLGNDLFTNRTPLVGGGGNIIGSTVGAGREFGEPFHWANTGGASVWHMWTAPASGQVTMDTFGSNFDTLLAVYTGNSVSALTRITNNDDSGGTQQSSVTFSAVAGVAYQIAVDGYSGATGTYRLRWSLPVPGPANDNFSNRQPLYGASGTKTGTNVAASVETGEPAHAGVSGGVSIWFSWTAPANGSVTFDTLQSNFDTLLAIYTGNNVGGLSHIVSNDNAPGVNQSSVTFSAIAGVTYRVAVDGRFGASGNVALRWNGAVVRYGRADFNGDGQSDLLWQNNFSGQRAIWFMNGTGLVGDQVLQSIGTEWRIAGNGDFDGDGQSDIVWQNNNTGQRAVWLMSGGNLLGARYLQTTPVAWQIATTGDFNGDGQTDLVWQNETNGQRAIWLMNGTTRINSLYLPTTSTQWSIAGAGDFNGDGQWDLLWQNTVTGQHAVWFMNGTAYNGGGYLPTISTAWRIVGTGNFNGDAQVDLVWQNDVTGQRAIWLMNGTTLSGSRYLPTISTVWEIVNH